MVERPCLFGVAKEVCQGTNMVLSAEINNRRTGPLPGPYQSVHC